MKALKRVNFVLKNVLGQRFKEKIVVIESDDWGSERFPDLNTIRIFEENGYSIRSCGFSSNDCLESNEDVEQLLNTLRRVQRNYKKTVKLTLLCNTANPDFSKIKKNGGEYDYASIPVTEKILDDQIRNQIISLEKEGENNGFFDLQYHGKEHINVNRWIRDLNAGVKSTSFAFDNQVWGLHKNYAGDMMKSYRETYDLDFKDDYAHHESHLVDGIKQFKESFKKEPIFFVAPDGPFNLSLTEVLQKNGIRYIGLPKKHFEPLGEGKTTKKYMLAGKDLGGVTVLNRNVMFEPMSRVTGCIANALDQIELCFSIGKPAVLSTHRANYVSGIHLENRTRGLQKLEDLLVGIIRRWPDVQFLSSPELGSLYNKSN